ncbi:MAG: hypothetical protein JST16_15585 [Bdellovibrionales bacterium]|nr:hypothetical protein [Bdellovibrionales bacterium]
MGQLRIRVPFKSTGTILLLVATGTSHADSLPNIEGASCKEAATVAKILCIEAKSSFEQNKEQETDAQKKAVKESLAKFQDAYSGLLDCYKVLNIKSLNTDFANMAGHRGFKAGQASLGTQNDQTGNNNQVQSRQGTAGAGTKTAEATKYVLERCEKDGKSFLSDLKLVGPTTDVCTKSLPKGDDIKGDEARSAWVKANAMNMETMAADSKADAQKPRTTEQTKECGQMIAGVDAQKAGHQSSIENAAAQRKSSPDETQEFRKNMGVGMMTLFTSKETRDVGNKYLDQTAPSTGRKLAEDFDDSLSYAPAKTLGSGADTAPNSAGVQPASAPMPAASGAARARAHNLLDDVNKKFGQ